MKTLPRFAKPIKYVAVASIFAVALHLPAAQAAIVGTETVAQTAATQPERGRLHDALDREAAKAKLLSLGVDPAQVQARVDTLTNEEAQALAKNLDAMPAGGEVSNLSLILIVILLLILL